MKIYIQVAALISAIGFSITRASAHPGHQLEVSAGHSHVSEYVIIGMIGIALLALTVKCLMGRGH